MSDIIGRESLELIAQQIFPEMLGIPIEFAAETYRGELVRACVSLDEHWTGNVELACSPSLARSTAAFFKSVAPEELTDADLNDAVSELANIAAGSVKALTASGRISCPRIIPSDNDSGTPLAALDIKTQAGPAMIRVFVRH
jgi:hypothetical protein